MEKQIQNLNNSILPSTQQESGKLGNAIREVEFRGYFKGLKKDRIYYIFDQTLRSLSLETLSEKTLIEHHILSHINQRIYDVSNGMCQVDQDENFLTIDFADRLVAIDIIAGIIAYDVPTVELRSTTPYTLSNGKLYYWDDDHLFRFDLITRSTISIPLERPHSLNLYGDSLFVKGKMQYSVLDSNGAGCYYLIQSTL